MADEILCTIDDHIATITLNRPEKRNALNSAALRALSATVAGLEDRPGRGGHTRRWQSF